jgi:hypothetical protein
MGMRGESDGFHDEVEKKGRRHITKTGDGGFGDVLGEEDTTCSIKPSNIILLMASQRGMQLDIQEPMGYLRLAAVCQL